MGRHGTQDSDLGVPGSAPRAWDSGAWDSAIGLDTDDSLYASGSREQVDPSAFRPADDCQPVNDWSGVYTVPPEAYQFPAQVPYLAQAQIQYQDYPRPPSAGFYDHEPPQQTAPPTEQSYYEQVYGAYTQTPQPVQPGGQLGQSEYAYQYSEQPQPSSPTWDGPAWQDPYADQYATDQYAADQYAADQYAPDPYAVAAFHGDPRQPRGHAAYALDEQYSPQNYGRQSYEPVSFHDPTFDTGQFEAVYAGPVSTDAAYDLLPEDGADDFSDGRTADAVHTDEYAGEFDDDYEYDLDYDREVEHRASEEDFDYDEPDAPIRVRSRSGSGGGGSSARGASRTPVRAPVRPARRRTLSAFATTPAAVVGVAAVAVAAVGGLRLPSTHQDAAAADPSAAPPTNGLAQNLLQMRAASASLADRASRAEQRTELTQQQALQRQKLAEMAPRFFLPVQDYALTASFGDSGVHWSSLHTGQDFAVPTGTRVVAVEDGVVSEASYAGAFGNRVVITHPDGSQTWYCHLSYIKVKSGPVKAGQLIAYSGDTGNSTGPHLHFEYHPPGTPDINNGVPGATAAIDPMPWIRSHGLMP